MPNRKRTPELCSGNTTSKRRSRVNERQAENQLGGLVSEGGVEAQVVAAGGARHGTLGSVRVDTGRIHRIRYKAVEDSLRVSGRSGEYDGLRRQWCERRDVFSSIKA